MSNAVAIVESAPRQRAERIQVNDPLAVMDTGRFEQMQRIASIMARSSLLPETLVGFSKGSGDNKEFVPYPFETIVANCFLVVNQAVGWSMDPFAVVQCASVVHGHVCYEGKLIAAAIERRLGFRLSYRWNEARGDAFGIVVSGKYEDATEPLTVEGTVAEWKTVGNRSPWASQPRKQLAYRGAREWARLHAPGVILGVYSDDDLESTLQRQERRPPPPPTLTVVERGAPAPAIEHKPAVEVAMVEARAEPVAAIEHKAAVEVARTSAQPEPATVSAAAPRRAPPPPGARPAPVAAPLDFAAAFRVALSVVKSIDEANAVYEEMVSKQEDTLSPEDIDECDAILREACDRFSMEEA